MLALHAGSAALGQGSTRRWQGADSLGASIAPRPSNRSACLNWLNFQLLSSGSACMRGISLCEILRIHLVSYSLVTSLKSVKSSYFRAFQKLHIAKVSQNQCF